MYYFLRASLYDIYWSHMSCNSNNSNNIDSIDTYYRDIANAMFSPLRVQPLPLLEPYMSVRDVEAEADVPWLKPTCRRVLAMSSLSYMYYWFYHNYLMLQLLNEHAYIYKSSLNR